VIYLDTAKQCAAWLKSQAVEAHGGLCFPHSQGSPAYDTTWCHGAAGVGDYFLDLYEAMGERTYLEDAKAVARWLTGVAVPDGDGYKWATFGRYEVGYATGTAGIGAFFLRLHQQGG
jgi:uncharacterized protein YyaL (SSP411 family)